MQEFADAREWCQGTHSINGALLPGGDVETPVFPSRIICKEHLVLARCLHQGVDFVFRQDFFRHGSGHLGYCKLKLVK